MKAGRLPIKAWRKQRFLSSLIGLFYDCVSERNCFKGLLCKKYKFPPQYLYKCTGLYSISEFHINVWKYQSHKEILLLNKLCPIFMFLVRDVRILARCRRGSWNTIIIFTESYLNILNFYIFHTPLGFHWGCCYSTIKSNTCFIVTFPILRSDGPI